MSFKGQFSNRDVWDSIVLSLSIGGLATGWFIIVDWLTSNGMGFPQTTGEFDEIWNYTETDTYFWVFISIAVVGPIVEELLFRGIIYDYLSRWNNPWVSILISAIIFGIWHGEPVQIGYTIIGGIIFGLAREYSKGLLLPMGMHILNNTLSTLPDEWYNWVGEPIYYLSILAIFLIYPIAKRYIKSIKVDQSKELI